MPTPPWEQTQCTGKHPFADKGLALSVAKRQRRNRDGAHSAVYRCTFCGAWHIGNHQPKQRSKRNDRGTT